MAARVWPFLIARGTQRGYSVLLAPDFLLADGDHGFLEEAIGAVPESDPVRVGVATSRRGRRVGLVWSEHRVTAADVGATADPRDEHSRPLRLLYGVLSAGDAPARAVLDDARRAALDTYRRFLADEHHFTTEPSTPLDVPSTPSTVSTPATPSNEPSVPIAFAATNSVAPPPVRRWTRGLVIPATVVLAAAAAAAVVIVVISSGSGEPAPSCPKAAGVAAPTTTTSSCGRPAPPSTS